MGSESGEHEQFHLGKPTMLNLDLYLADPDRSHVRQWWRELNLLRRNPAIQGPSPLRVHFAAEQIPFPEQDRTYELSAGESIHRSDRFLLDHPPGGSAPQRV